MSSSLCARSFRAAAVIFVLGFLSSFGLAAQDAAFTPIVVARHGFESGQTHKWVTRGAVGTAAVSKDVAHSGDSSLKMSDRTVDWHMPRVELTSVLERGAKYHMELWVRIAAGEKDAAMNLTMLTRYPTNDVEASISGDIPASASAWTLLEGDFVWDPTAAGAFLYVYFRGSVTANYYVDDLKITKTAANAPLPGVKLDSFKYDFEKDAQGWGPRGSVSLAVAAEAAHSGALGLATSGRGENWHGPAINLGEILKRGAVYDFTAYLRLASAPSSASTVKFTMEEKSGGKTAWATVAQATAGDDKWILMKGSYSFASAMDALTLYAESSSASDVIYIDDVKIDMTVPPPAAPAYQVQKDLVPLKDGFLGYWIVGAAVAPFNVMGVPGDLVMKHFNSVVAENAMKPAYIEPQEGVFFWDEADAIVKFAKANAKLIRFHTLQWHSQCPNWFFLDKEGKEMVDEKDPVKREANKKLLLARLENHVKTIVDRYKRDIRYWDVVNEVVDPAGPGGMRDSKWYQIAGKDYIGTAFRAASEAGGSYVKLYINDYNTHDPAKRDIILSLVKELRAKGLQVDGVGHQTHISLTYPPIAQIKESIRMCGELGLDNQITELDLSVYSDSVTGYTAVPDELLVKQAYRYKELFDAFRELNAYISSVTFWGIGDGTSWLQNRPIKRVDAPLLFDANFQAKYAYYALMDPSKLPALPAAPKPKVQPKLGEAVKGTPVVDAEIDAAWSKAKLMDLNITVTGKPTVTAKVRALWDKDFLYALFEVTDPLLNKKSVNAYEQDSVEVFMDENCAKAGAYQKDDGQFRVNYENAKSYGSNGEDKRLLSAAKIVDGGYLVELAVPFRTTQGAAGMVIGFDAQVNDADATGRRIGIIKWNDASDNTYRDTVNMGELKLAE